MNLVVDPIWGPWAEPALACLKPGGRYLNVGAAAGDGAAFHVELLRAAQLTLIGFSGAAVNPADAIASYHHVAALAANGSFALQTATYSLAEAAQAWEAQASSTRQEDRRDSLNSPRSGTGRSLGGSATCAGAGQGRSDAQSRHPVPLRQERLRSVGRRHDGGFQRHLVPRADPAWALRLVARMTLPCRPAGLAAADPDSGPRLR